MNPLTQFKKIRFYPFSSHRRSSLARSASATLPPGNTAAQWNTIAENTVVGSGAFQAEGYIYMAYTSAAVYDAVVAIEGGFEPYGPPITAPPGASVDCAVIEAAYRTLVNYFPFTGGTLGALYAEALSNFGGCTGDGGGGTLVGQTAATNIIDLTDGRWADDPDRHDVVVSHAAASPGRVATNAAIRATADAVGGERAPIHRAEPRPIPARSAAVASER